jgi:mutator protein MutT
MIKGIDYIGVSAGAMIINDRGEIFLAQRGPKAKNERGCWENPGGSVEFGEKLVDAVKREIMEEYGAEIEVIEQFPAEDHLIPAEHQHWIATTFLAKFVDGSVPKIMEPDKCTSIGFFSLDNLPQPLSIITQLDIEHHGHKIKLYSSGGGPGGKNSSPSSVLA